MKLDFPAYILNAFNGAADIVTDGGYVYMGSTSTTVTVPRQYFLNGKATLIKSQLEVLSTILVTGSVANSTVYSFTLTQQDLVTGQNRNFYISYTSDATATDAEIATGLTAYINALITSAGLHAAATNSGLISTGITITGLTLYAPITYSAASNVTIANSLSVANVSSTNATPIVMTTAASTYVVGQIVTISGHLVNTNANGTWRVRATNGTTTVTLEALDGSDSVGNGVGANTGTTAKVASLGTGLGAQVAAIVNPTPQGTAISSNNYTMLTWEASQPDAEDLTTRRRVLTRQTIYLNESGANYAAYLVALRNVLNGLDVTGAAVDADLIAIV